MDCTCHKCTHFKGSLERIGTYFGLIMSQNKSIQENYDDKKITSNNYQRGNNAPFKKHKQINQPFLTENPEETDEKPHSIHNPNFSNSSTLVLGNNDDGQPNFKIEKGTRESFPFY